MWQAAKMDIAQYTINSNFAYICEKMFLDNLFLNIIICVLTVAVTIKCLKDPSFKNRIIALAITTINVIFVIYKLFGLLFPEWGIYFDFNMQSFDMLISIIYAFSLLLMPIVMVRERRAKTITLFAICSAAIMAAPLMIVTPINARCIFPCFIMLMLYTCGLFNYIYNGVSDKALSLLSSVMLSLIILVSLFYTVSFIKIKQAETERIAYMQVQQERGDENIIVGRLPLFRLMWGNVPRKNSKWINIFKSFYGIDKNKKLQYVQYSEFKQIIQDDY